MKLLTLSQGQFAKVDDEDFEYLNQWKWSAVKRRRTYYAMRVAYSYRSQKTIYLHRLLMKTPEGLEVDHKNGDGLDCQKENMRNCTNMQNHESRRVFKPHSSKYKGVFWWKNKWQSAIRIQGEQYYLGTFSTEEKAALAYDAKAREGHGEFAIVNFPL